MKYFLSLPLLSLAILLYSCGGNSSDNSNSQTNQSEAVRNEAEAKKVLTKDPRKIGPEKPESQKAIEANIYKINGSDNPLYGYWVGAFGKNKINIAIAYRKNDSIFGHSVCAGNFRPIKGTIKETATGIYQVNMFEPGDDQYDGEFNFSIDVNKKELNGKWKPYKSTTAAKSISLINESLSMIRRLEISPMPPPGTWKFLMWKIYCQKK
ncbi:MAG: hypothetical protein ACK40G_01535 [Cytophagaceae bacterium]